MPLSPCMCAFAEGALCKPENSIADFGGNPACKKEEADACFASREAARIELEKKQRRSPSAPLK